MWKWKQTKSVTVLALALVFSFAAVAVAVRAQEQSAAPEVSTKRKVKTRSMPDYPVIAKQMHITGTVVVTATVDASGKVLKAESTSGNKLLSGSAIDAVKQWKFAPGDTTDTFPVSINFAMDSN